MRPRVIIFCFAGRKPNMELQLPFIQRILEENRNAEFDIWNLARDNGDSKYLQTIDGDRITVRNEYRRASPGYDHVFRHYGHEDYRGTVFVKLDDDIVFLQTERFHQFIRAIQANPTAVLSANVINNGACTPLQPELFEKFQRIAIPLLDVHKSGAFAGVAHNYFFDHTPELLDQPIELIPTKDWLSINAIGYTWKTGQRIAKLVFTKCARQNVAGRDLDWLGDEGTVNTMPRILVRGFLACHLTFGPQNLIPLQLAPWRERYKAIADHYLAHTVACPDIELPGLSEVSHAQGLPVITPDWRERWTPPPGENDPLVGRYKG
jgi:hypothetical protein